MQLQLNLFPKPPLRDFVTNSYVIPTRRSQKTNGTGVKFKRYQYSYMIKPVKYNLKKNQAKSFY